MKSAPDRTPGPLSSKIIARVIFFFVFGFSFLYFLFGITQVVDFYDEGIPVYGADRVLHGELPYRDFWTIYAPGQFYVLAGLFKIFGSSVLVERLYDTTVRALVSTIVFLIFFRLSSRGWGLLFWLLITVWLKFFGYYAASTFPALVLALVSLWLLFPFLDQSRPKKWLFLSGILAGSAALFRQDFGLYAFVSEVLVLVAFVYKRVGLKKAGKAASYRRQWWVTEIGPYFLGFGLILFPTLGYLLYAVPVKELVYDLVIFPVKIFPDVRRLPFLALFPNPMQLVHGEQSVSQALAELSHRWAFYFTPISFVAVIGFMLFGKRPTHERDGPTNGDAAWSWKTGLFLAFGLLSFNNIRIRFDLPHLMPAFVSAGLLTAALTTRLLKLNLFRKHLVRASGLGSVFLLFVFPLYELLKPGLDEPFRSMLYSHHLERAKGVGVNPFQASAIQYIQTVTSPQERIFVGDNRHDLIYNNDVVFYFLAERSCAGRYHELSPGAATSRRVQAEIVADLQRHHVRYLVIFSRFKRPGVTNEPVPVHFLDDFIAQNYQPVKTFGNWSVWEIK